MFKKKWFKLVLLLVVALLAVAIVGYQFIGSIVKTGITTIGPKLTGCPITLESLSLRPLRGKLELTNLVVGNPEGFKTSHAFALGKVRIQLDPGSVLSDTIHVQEIYIEAPEITYEISLHGSNLGKIQETVIANTGGAAKPEEKPTTEKAGKKVIIDRVSVTGAKIRLATVFTGSGAAPIPLPDIEIKDIGKEKQGATMGEAINQIVTAVITSVTDIATKAGGAVGGAAKDLGGAVKDGASDVVKGVKSLFGGDDK